MKAREIIKALMRDRWRENFVLPNYTPDGWWECDVFELSAAQYFSEFEVKVTRDDFFVDAKKTREVWPRPFGAPAVLEKKHDLLANSDRGPCRFWFVTPKDLLKPEEIPVWAGLIEAEIVESDGSAPRIALRQIVNAPRRHKNKFTAGASNHVRGTCYYRLHQLIEKEAS